VQNREEDDDCGATMEAVIAVESRRALISIWLLPLYKLDPCSTSEISQIVKSSVRENPRPNSAADRTAQLFGELRSAQSGILESPRDM